MKQDEHRLHHTQLHITVYRRTLCGGVLTGWCSLPCLPLGAVKNVFHTQIQTQAQTEKPPQKCTKSHIKFHRFYGGSTFNTRSLGGCATRPAGRGGQNRRTGMKGKGEEQKRKGKLGGNGNGVSEGDGRNLPPFMKFWICH